MTNRETLRKTYPVGTTVARAETYTAEAATGTVVGYATKHKTLFGRNGRRSGTGAAYHVLVVESEGYRVFWTAEMVS